MKFEYFSLLVITVFSQLKLQSCIQDLNSPLTFSDEICSYNGLYDASTSNSTYLNCICQPEYTNEPNNSKIKYINGVNVQCSYEKKRRFIALFLAIFLPLGFEHLYLGNYYLFVLIFSFCGFTFFGNFFRFAIASHNNYFKNKINLLFISFALFIILWWIINIILVWTGTFKDGNGVETVNDLDFLININN